METLATIEKESESQLKSKPRGRPPKVPHALDDSPPSKTSEINIRKSNREKKIVKYTK